MKSKQQQEATTTGEINTETINSNDTKKVPITNEKKSTPVMQEKCQLLGKETLTPTTQEKTLATSERSSKMDDTNDARKDTNYQ
ncbi:22110_t:CDS:2 [Dentiscutata erythropus]|uniref:22110_t:CDS:1 n=1 Tax=Dentiscutata erythropus TaxID=1348616 RepID=A0A9N8WS57_9GLOM|nr:22110_t:CDS:2 [Dentiscutata erythropus]